MLMGIKLGVVGVLLCVCLYLVRMCIYVCCTRFLSFDVLSCYCVTRYEPANGNRSSTPNTRYCMVASVTEHGGVGRTCCGRNCSYCSSERATSRRVFSGVATRAIHPQSSRGVGEMDPPFLAIPGHIRTGTERRRGAGQHFDLLDGRPGGRHSSFFRTVRVRSQGLRDREREIRRTLRSAT